MPMPPSLSGAPPMGASPISVPSGSPGSNAGAMAKVREAINILQSALPELGAGTEPYKAVLSTLQSLNKFIPPSAEVPGIQKTAVNDLARQAQQSAMMRQVMASLGGQGGGMPAPAGLPG